MSLSDEYYRALGRVAHDFAVLEVMVASSVWVALGDLNSKQFRAVTVEMSAAQKLGLLESLVAMREVDAERLALWKHFFAEARVVATERNRLLHSPLLRGGVELPSDFLKTLQYQRTVGASRGDIVTKEYSASDIERVADRIVQARGALFDLVVRK